jgi:hypothetical protein
MADYQQDRSPIHLAEGHPDRPAIHVSLASDVTEDCYHWVEIGAEEEGVPCRQAPAAETDVVRLAYAAAQSSRLGVGVGVTYDQVAVHEFHMPAARAVLVYEAKDKVRHVCRLAGSNAARLVVCMPLRFDEV